MAFTKSQFEKLVDHTNEIKEACENVEEARDNYWDAEDSEEREQARSDAYDATQEIKRLTEDGTYRGLLTELAAAV